MDKNLDNALFDDEPDNPFLPPIPQPGDTGGQPAAAAHSDTRTPEQRTADLLEEMQPYRATLLGILALCQEPRAAEEVAEEVDRLKRTNGSVYSAGALCLQLERSGALERRGEVEQVEPELVEEGGASYLKPRPTRHVLWATTPVGAAALEGYRPQDALTRLLGDEERYLSIYLELLLMCARDEGADAAEMGAAVDADPLLAHPRLYAAHFFGNLADRDAIAWDGGRWHATELGYETIARLQEAGIAERA